MDGVVSNVDPKRRHLSQFFKEEIADKYGSRFSLIDFIHCNSGLDISIGVESYADYLRSATLTPPTNFDYLRDILLDLRMLVMIGAYYFQPSNSILSLSVKNPYWMKMDEANTALNRYSIQRLKLSAINGLSNASNLSRLFAIFINGSMVSQQLLNKLRQPVLNGWHFEQTVLYPIRKGYGFLFDPHPKQSVSGPRHEC